MFVSTAELHLRRARKMDDPGSAIAEYMRAIEEAVRELKQSPPAQKRRRR